MSTNGAPLLSRENSGWLSVPEQRAIGWLASRLPDWLSPNALTALGFAAALAAFASYLLVPGNPAWLWAVNAALVVNWFGDSMDGAIARRRGIARPRFGFFLDQSTDVASQFLFALGLGLSGLVRLEIAAFGLAAFLMMSVQSLLRAQVTQVFQLASGGMGLTEVRCLFLLANVLFYFVPPTPLWPGTISWGYGDVFGIVWIAVNLGLYAIMMAKLLKQLAKDEPARPKKPGKPT
jgi:archaetidylinositol phosphate synthase